MAGKPMQAKYCSTRCREIASGVRRAEALPEKICELADCGVVFQPRRAMQRCCSEKHGKALWNRQSRADGRQKPPPWSDARRDRYHRRRAQKRAASTGEPVLLAAIAERDAWQCSLCTHPIDPAVAWPDSLSPSLDHRVPLSKGGAHDPSNVFLAHLGCNSSKGDRLMDDGPLLTG
ncbi:HNH endonuclease signature motif containing protein [Streptomyces sp. NPDC006544]|uniref:HNH endonuclease n=1 Tax=Streptomyces sp. NPDC006544 TaxID=3154583 RepID=UPI0033AC2EB1